MAADGGRRRPDEGDAGVEAGLGELGILGEKAVARVHAVGARRLGDRNQFVDTQITFGGRRRANVMRFVTEAHMQRAGIGLRIDGDGAQSEALGRAGDAAGDLAAVSDQYRGKHQNPDAGYWRVDGSSDCGA